MLIGLVSISCEKSKKHPIPYAEVDIYINVNSAEFKNIQNPGGFPGSLAFGSPEQAFLFALRQIHL